MSDILSTAESEGDHPIVRPMIKSLRENPESGYNPSARTHGFVQELVAHDGERLAAKMGAAFFELKNALKKQGCKVNAPEIFPVNEKSCLVLVTGWIPESIVLKS
jgi:hypothetical protein